MGEEDVEQLVADGIVRRCERDPEGALAELAAARLHLESAAKLAGPDPNGAFQLAYDGTRKAIGAHMRARGLRVGSGAGAHVKTGRYAQAALDDPALAPHVAAFDDLRAVRNQSEYDALLLDEADVVEALSHAHAIVDAVERGLP
jgi:hypothetical protein